MTRSEYLTMKNERDVLKEEIIALAEVTGESEGRRQMVEKLLTLTRILDRAASDYSVHKNDISEEGFCGRHYDYDYQSDP
jgi:hypothetical protein